MKNQFLVALLLVGGQTLHSQIKISEFKPQKAEVVVAPVKKEANGCGMNVNYQNFTYTTVNIGSQCWMRENLRNTSFSDGSPITQGKEIEVWINGTEGKWCDYEDEKENKTMVEEYGKLYNWYVVSDPRNICPKGWHVPSDEEWNELVNYLGGELLAGDILKTHAPDWNGRNLAGFNALPGGFRSNLGGFKYKTLYGFWWTKTEASNVYAWCRNLPGFENTVIRNNYFKKTGFSIRCLKDGNSL